VTVHRFGVGNVVRVSSAHDLEAGRVGLVADPPEDIKSHQVAQGLGSYKDHVRVDPSGVLLYWVQFAPARRPGEAEAVEVEEKALELVGQ
jgi:hypothetical protein